MVFEKEKILLKPQDIKPSSKIFEVLGVLNPGAARLPDGRIVLYVRVIERLKKWEDRRNYYSPRMVGKGKYELIIDKFKKSSAKAWDDIAIIFHDGTKRLSYISHLRRVILNKRGFKIISIDKKPGFYGFKDDGELGIEDARITKIGDHYYMTYVSLGRKENIATNLAVSKNCFNWERKGIIFGEQDKDVVLFPEKINERYVAFDRPEGNFEFTAPHIWIAYSKDLFYWGKLKPVFFSKKGKVFVRSGAGPPPIKTDKGWLLIFHGVTQIPRKGFIVSVKRALGVDVEPGPDSYAVWVALFDLKNPGKIIARSKHPIIHPKTKSFESKMVIFPTGAVEDNKGNLLLYSGAGDIYVNVRKIKLKKIMDFLETI